MLFILNILFMLQTDTLTAVYSQKWDGPEQSDGFFAELMTSNDMIFVVLGVSLIIWFTLLFFIARTEKKLKDLENTLNN